MIERRIAPRDCVVTHGAIVTETSCDVVGICDSLELRLVALVTIDVHELVVVAGVTRLARKTRVRAGEGEIRLSVVERSPAPARCRVTHGTIVTEISGDVIRVGRAGEVIRMAVVAHGRQPLIAVIDVTI